MNENQSPQVAQSMAKTISDLVTKANNKALNRTFKRGVVSVANSRYADVQIEGNATATKNIFALGNYFPTVGDKVLVLSIGETGTNLLILGPLYTSGGAASSEITSASSITPSSSMYSVTALAENATIASPGASGNGDRRILRIKDNGSARTLTWNSIYRAIGTTLPAVTVANKVLYVGMIYNTQDSKWDVITVALQA